MHISPLENKTINLKRFENIIYSKIKYENTT